MEKFRNTEIKPFQFSDLQSTHVVQQTQLKPFEFKTLQGESISDINVSEEDIRTERKFAKKNNFKIDDIVRDYRGLSRQEQNDLEQRIQEEVKRRLDAAYEEAYKEGIERGQNEGREAAQNEFQETLLKRIEDLDEVIAKVNSQSDKILENNKQEVYEFIKRFTKWILLKEIN